MCCQTGPLSQDERLTRLLRRCGHYLYHQSCYGQSQDAVLRLLRENGPMSNKELQRQLSIRPGSVSELISKLERKGLLCRERDREDKRMVTLSLTEAGRQTGDFVPLTAPDKLYEALSDEERTALEEILEKLLESWQSQRSENQT